MSICCVEGCDVQDSDDITYFTFPIKPALRKKWRAAIKSVEKLHDDSKVCERHFNEKDYELIRGKLRLKAGVVPCIFTNDKSSNKSQAPSSETEQPIKNNSEKASETLTGQEPTSDEGQEPFVDNHREPSVDTPQGPSVDNHQEPLSDGHHEELHSTPDFMTLADLCTVQTNDSAENCTIECVPEAVLNHDSDSHSETDIHKEDIENIIANYHIKQNKEVAERLKASEELDRQKQIELKENGEKNEKNLPNGDNRSENSTKKAVNVENSVKSVGNSNKSNRSVGTSNKSVRNSDKSVASGLSVSRSAGSWGRKAERSRRGKKAARIASETRSVRSSQDSDCILTEEPKPQFVEISVDKSDKDNGDCMMLLESVQVDVDPSALLDGYHPFIADEPPTKEEAISLLTSSDSDDVILQEPHIDTVEVSSSDSDSKPLVSLATGKMRRLYPCFECKYTTYSIGQYRKHRHTHTRPEQLVCSCGAEVDSKAELKRHERSHRKLQCALCNYSARHNSALVCHMQTHGVTVQTVHMSDGSVMIKEDNGKQTKTRKKLKRKRYKCEECSYVGAHRRDLDAHVEELH